MSLCGYSERGIVNSIAYYLDAHPQSMHGFIKALGIPLIKNNYDYTFLVEQSFSDFGDSDLVIIANDKEKNSKIVIFVECKIKTYNGTFKIDTEFCKIQKAIHDKQKFKGISSNLFIQLYYKYLLIKTDGNSGNDPDVDIIFKKTKNNPRKLGDNQIVKDAFLQIKGAKNYYYVAIVPPEHNKTDNKNNNIEFRSKIDKLGLMESKNVYLSYWDDIKSFFKEKDATKVLEVFKYNGNQIYET
jgi:hypothetical protein